jgi:hypothetical protein
MIVTYSYASEKASQSFPFYAHNSNATITGSKSKIIYLGSIESHNSRLTINKCTWTQTPSINAANSTIEIHSYNAQQSPEVKGNMNSVYFYGTQKYPWFKKLAYTTFGFTLGIVLSKWAFK